MKIDRLIGIITILTQNEKTTAPYLAKRLEVSRRTILRDIDTLSQAGIPIVTIPGGSGGIYIADGYKLDKSVFTADELANIVAGLKSLDSVANTSDIQHLMTKIAPNRTVESIAGNILIDLSSFWGSCLSEKISVIRSAIKERRMITFDYYSAKGKTNRTIEPYYVAFKWSAWYAVGFCTERQDFRMFKLTRLWELAVSDEIYTARQIQGEEQLLSGFEDTAHIDILFDKSMNYRLIETYGLNCYTETDEGLLLSVDYINKEYILSWILGFGDKAEIVSPCDIRAEYAEIVKNMYENIR